MQFAHTLQQVLDGTKTQTSRIVKPGYPGDYATYRDSSGRADWIYTNDIKRGDLAILNEGIMRVTRNGRMLWQVGNTYAVQPGCGKKAVARIRILKIRQMDVREFTAEDVIQEGFDYTPDFLVVWCKMHDPHCMWPWRLSFVKAHRPAEHYTAWTINFELVK